jgi:hypothetical protein
MIPDLLQDRFWTAFEKNAAAVHPKAVQAGQEEAAVDSKNKSMYA